MTSFSQEQMRAIVCFLEDQKNKNPNGFSQESLDKVCYRDTKVIVKIEYRLRSDNYFVYVTTPDLLSGSIGCTYDKKGWFWQKDPVLDRIRAFFPKQEVLNDLDLIEKYIPDAKKYILAETLEEDLLKKK